MNVQNVRPEMSAMKPEDLVWPDDDHVFSLSSDNYFSPFFQNWAQTHVESNVPALSWATVGMFG